MQRCNRCLMPVTKPGLKFEDGVCQGCLNYDKRETIDWNGRKDYLKAICNRFCNEKGYDCVIAVSGGKDSHFIVNKLTTECNMHPLLVTVTDSFTHTKAGLHNLRNLHNMYDGYIYTINHNLFVKATRWAFEQTGNALMFVEYAIYLIPCIIAERFNIPLVFFGENSAYEYGTTKRDSYWANQAIHWLIYLIFKDAEWWDKGGISEIELKNIIPEMTNIHTIFMSYFYPWSSTEHLRVAKLMGFKDLDDTKEWKRESTIEQFEQIDSYGYLLHLWLRYPRHGYQRVTDIVSRSIREGLMNQKEGMRLINKYDPQFDRASLNDFCNVCGYSTKQFWDIVFNAPWNKYYKEGVLK